MNEPWKNGWRVDLRQHFPLLAKCVVCETHARAFATVYSIAIYSLIQMAEKVLDA